MYIANIAKFEEYAKVCGIEDISYEIFSAQWNLRHKGFDYETTLYMLAIDWHVPVVMIKNFGMTREHFNEGENYHPIHHDFWENLSKELNKILGV